MRYAATFLLMIIAFNLHAQQIHKSIGESLIRLDPSSTFNQVAEKAIDEAKANAIENQFGIYVEEQTEQITLNEQSTFNVYGTTKVKGEWIETIGTPEISTIIQEEDTRFGKQNVTYIKCKIFGKVREIMPKAILQYEILNAPNLQSRTKDFINGEQLYIYFKSPVDGYLSLFLEDDEGVYRLLPYMKMNPDYKNGVPVLGDVEYTFFSPALNFYSKSIVDEMIMTLTKEKLEYNYIYIVFSEDKYIKPSLKKSFKSKERIIPSSLSKWEFDRWLANNKVSSTSFQLIKKRISIKERK